jgi:hypothetical protein
MEKMILSLRMPETTRARLDQFLDQASNPSNPAYHRWLTPEQFGAQFGASQADVDRVSLWLLSQGFKIDEVAPGRLSITFSGTCDQVEQAFRTVIMDYSVNGKVRHANAVEPSIPKALAGCVSGVVTLNNFPRTPYNTGFKPVPFHPVRLNPSDLKSPFYTGKSGSNYLAPGDFATIYNLKPQYTAGNDGTGVGIAIVGRTHIGISDLTLFRSRFGLPANQATIVVNGPDPGDMGSSEDGEAYLDAEWSGAVAKSASVFFVVSRSTTATDGVDLSANYIVQKNLAPIMSTSFGSCESGMGATENAFYNNLWSQAAAQGITSFVSSGDNGAAGCDSASATSGTGQAISGLASTPYNVAVGGTQLDDAGGSYWASTNNADQSSALSYIPEVAWNESSLDGGSGLWASSGGTSTLYSKPSWQVAPGVPADGKRDIPDVALTAATHDGYLVYQGGKLGAVGGTSAASPSFAGIMALIVQKTQQRWGNANTKLYPLAATQYGAAGTAVFHDTTTGNNSVQGVTGFTCGTGFDQVTGLGSVDASALVTAWGGTGTVAPSFAYQPVDQTVTAGQLATFSVSALGNPKPTLQWYRNGTLISGATGNAYSVTTASVSDSAQFTCIATNASGTSTSTAATLTVNAPMPTSGTFNLLVNPGFEQGVTGWTFYDNGMLFDDYANGSTGPFPAHGPHLFAVLGDWPSAATTDYVYQTVTIPANATAASFNFWLQMKNGTQVSSTAPNVLSLQVRDGSGNTVLATPIQWDSTKAASYASYAQTSPVDLMKYVGQTITLYLTSVQPGGSNTGTDFLVDDCNLSVTLPSLGPSVSLSPASITMVNGGTHGLTPTVSGGTSNTVTWASASGGTVPGTATPSGTPETYTAPAAGTSDTVTVTTVDTPVATATSTITLVQPNAVTVTVSPASVELMAGSTAAQTFTATVNPLTDQGVTWSCTGGATVSSGGVFNASGLAAGTYTVKGTSTASPTSPAGTATVTLVSPSSVTITVAPVSTSTVVGGTIQFTASVTGLSGANSGVNWTVNGGGTIDKATGLFTATTVTTTPITVTATSTFDSTIQGTATLSVKPLDLNGDGTVDLQDLLYFAQFYGTRNTTCDLNGDGVVDDKDLGLLLGGL